MFSYDDPLFRQLTRANNSNSFVETTNLHCWLFLFSNFSTSCLPTTCLLYFLSALLPVYSISCLTNRDSAVHIVVDETTSLNASQDPVSKSTAGGHAAGSKPNFEMRI